MPVMTKNGLKRGDAVEKIQGYKFPGKIVAVFKNMYGCDRVVVECTCPAAIGCLQIFNPFELHKINPNKRPVKGSDDDFGDL